MKNLYVFVCACLKLTVIANFRLNPIARQHAFQNFDVILPNCRICSKSRIFADVAAWQFGVATETLRRQIDGEIRQRDRTTRAWQEP